MRSLLIPSVSLMGRLAHEPTDHSWGIAPVPFRVRPEPRRPGWHYRSPIFAGCQHSLTQLLPPTGTTLAIVSVIVNRAGGGTTINDLIDELRSTLSGEVAPEATAETLAPTALVIARAGYSISCICLSTSATSIFLVLIVLGEMMPPENKSCIASGTERSVSRTSSGRISTTKPEFGSGAVGT